MTFAQRPERNAFLQQMIKEINIDLADQCGSTWLPPKMSIFCWFFICGLNQELLPRIKRGTNRVAKATQKAYLGMQIAKYRHRKNDVWRIRAIYCVFSSNLASHYLHIICHVDTNAKLGLMLQNWQLWLSWAREPLSILLFGWHSIFYERLPLLAAAAAADKRSLTHLLAGWPDWQRQQQFGKG